MTKNENVADIGALQIAHKTWHILTNGKDRSLPGLEGLRPSQLFFISAAQVILFFLYISFLIFSFFLYPFYNFASNIFCYKNHYVYYNFYINVYFVSLHNMRFTIDTK